MLKNKQREKLKRLGFSSTLNPKDKENIYWTKETEYGDFQVVEGSKENKINFFAFNTSEFKLRHIIREYNLISVAINKGNEFYLNLECGEQKLLYSYIRDRYPLFVGQTITLRYEWEEPFDYEVKVDEEMVASYLVAYGRELDELIESELREYLYERFYQDAEHEYYKSL